MVVVGGWDLFTSDELPTWTLLMGMAASTVWGRSDEADPEQEGVGSSWDRVLSTFGVPSSVRHLLAEVTSAGLALAAVLEGDGGPLMKAIAVAGGLISVAVIVYDGRLGE